MKFWFSLFVLVVVCVVSRETHAAAARSGKAAAGGLDRCLKFRRNLAPLKYQLEHCKKVLDSRGKCAGECLNIIDTALSSLNKPKILQLQILILIYAAAEGQLDIVKKIHASEFDLNSADYDNRTAIHLASAEGHLNVVDYLIKTGKVNPKPADRWGHLPLDEAKRFGHPKVVQYLEKNCESQEKKSQITIVPVNLIQPGLVPIKMSAKEKLTCLNMEITFNHLKPDLDNCNEANIKECHQQCAELDTDVLSVMYKGHLRELKNTGLLFAASEGTYNVIVSEHQNGMDMGIGDYDKRTAIHLASADGHLNIVKYLIKECKVNPKPADRWGHLPIDEARKFNHTSIVDFLKENGGA